MNFIYSDTQDLGFTFVCIRKNASSSIGNTLYSLKSGSSYEDESFPRYVNGTDIFVYRPKNEIPSLSDTFNFICLRDPFERTVSLFMHKIIYHPNTQEEAVKEYFNYNPEHRQNIDNLESYFEDFLLFLEQCDLSSADEHIAYQYTCGAFDKIKYDLILNFSNIDWQSVKNNIPGMPDLPPEKIHNTGSSYNASQFRQKFEPRVKDIYKKDYDLIKDLGIQGLR